MIWNHTDENGYFIQDDKNYGGVSFYGVRSRVYGLLPDEIIFRGGELQFNGTSTSTTSLIVKDESGNEIKTIDFDQSQYAFCGTGTFIIPTRYLDSVRIEKSGKVLERYSFKYDKSCLSDLKGGDAWGGVNQYSAHISSGNAYNSVPMQEVNLENANCTSDPFYFSIGFGHKEPQILYGMSGILTRITYPTGGYTDFTYESNVYRTSEGDLRAAGGLRIQKIQHFDKADATSAYEKNYKYGENEDGAGILKLIPQLDSWDLGYKYHQNVYYVTGWNVSDPFAQTIVATEDKTTYLSSSVRDMSFASGAPIHYTQVTEYQKDLGTITGKTVYEYDKDAYNGYNPSYLYEGTNLAVEQSSWHMGKLKKETVYKYTGSTYDWIKQKTYSYTTYTEDEQIRVEKAFLTNLYSGMGEEGYSPSDFVYLIYGLKVGNMLLSQEKEEWKENGNILTKTTDYYYLQPDKNPLPNRVVTTTSDGKSLIHYTSYPLDFVDGTSFVDDLRLNHILNRPIESVLLQDQNGMLKILEGKLTTYTATGLIDKSYSLEITDPIPLSAFKFSNAVLGTVPWAGNLTTFSSDASYKEKIAYSSFDNRGNPLVITPKDNVTVVYLWDYSQTYPIAQANNVTDVNDIAYTSFEAEGNGGWSGINASDIDISVNAITGNKQYVLNGTNSLTKTGLNSSSTYIVTYWSKNGSYTVNGTTGTSLKAISFGTENWTCYRHAITNPSNGAITVSGTGRIDELRLYPFNAVVTTYAFKPLIGRTEQCDENNKIIHYNYAYGRLESIWDENWNIVKKICYNYAGQAQDCGASGKFVTIKYKNVQSSIVDGYYVETADLYFQVYNSNAEPLTLNAPLVVYFDAIQRYVDLDETVLSSQSTPSTVTIPTGSSEYLYSSNMQIKSYPVDASGAQTAYRYETEAELTEDAAYTIIGQNQ